MNNETKELEIEEDYSWIQTSPQGLVAYKALWLSNSDANFCSRVTICENLLFLFRKICSALIRIFFKKKLG